VQLDAVITVMVICRCMFALHDCSQLAGFSCLALEETYRNLAGSYADTLCILMQTHDV